MAKTADERLNDLDHERLFLLAGILAEEDNKNLLKASGLDKAMNNIKKIAEIAEVDTETRSKIYQWVEDYWSIYNKSTNFLT